MYEYRYQINEHKLAGPPQPQPSTIITKFSTAVPVVQVDLWTCRYRYQINEHKLAGPPQPSTILKYM